MLITNARLVDIIGNLGLQQKYSLTDYDITNIVGYLHGKIGTGSDYQSDARIFAKHVNIYFKKDGLTVVDPDEKFADYIREYSKKKSFMYKFSVYLQNNYKTSAAAKFLEEFIGKPVDEILTTCSKINMANAQFQYKKSFSLDIVKRALDYHFIMVLARQFYVIQINIKHNIFNVTTYQYYYDLYESMMNAVANNRDLAACIAENIPANDYGDLETKNKLDAVNTDSYNIYNKIQQFLKNSRQYIVDKCQKNPDLNAIIGDVYCIDSKKSIDNLFNGSYSFVKYILDNFDTSEKNIKPKPEFQLPEPRKLNHRLVIEI